MAYYIYNTENKADWFCLVDDHPEEIPFEEGDFVLTEEGQVGKIVGFYPIFELGTFEYFVEVSDTCLVYREDQLEKIL
ncbi:MAG: hypothetical protein KJ064_26675 [Anaerolineae bacterium]|nr:MAG: hypothetical protein F9K27_15215 [Anaerolineae bacterium]MCL4880268.1 hypothetical protein [Anaerolineae bacterium]